MWNTFKKLGSSESLMVDGSKKLIIKPSLWKLHGCNIKFTVSGSMVNVSFIAIYCFLKVYS